MNLSFLKNMDIKKAHQDKYILIATYRYIGLNENCGGIDERTKCCGAKEAIYKNGHGLVYVTCSKCGLKLY